ncbi:MAG TPA: MarR family transcriptional regulator [Capsulimonadaceae bacterium]
MKVPLRGELLAKLSQRYPSVDPVAIDTLNTLKSVSQDMSDRLSDRLGEHGLTEGKFFVLAYIFMEDLAGHPSPRPSEIADNVGVTRGTITGLLDGLERTGMIERCADPTDRRVLTISMSEKAKAFLDDFLPLVGALMQPLVTDALAPDEQGQLLALLTKLETHLRSR